MKKIDNHEDIIDSRDVIERIAELTRGWESGELDDDEAHELATLRALADEGERYAEDWRHGATLISENYFTEYAQELAEDIGVLDRDARWPANHIDWEAAANELKIDYNEVDYDGVTYYVR